MADKADNRRMKPPTLVTDLKIPPPPNYKLKKVEIKAGGQTIVVDNLNSIIEVIATYTR